MCNVAAAGAYDRQFKVVAYSRSWLKEVSMAPSRDVNMAKKHQGGYSLRIYDIYF
ncbi:hypothetical protein PoMZ_05534 [Pyricularia oryzae]|uniref:Uncharacterized protein n=1 Tax=Pyricularia oryzae TaxID=318829 RepID=A0A4P7NNF5_PYROR|nr:hypothetical protein PoMZ_05534 [Pyricularia oryzae]